MIAKCYDLQGVRRWLLCSRISTSSWHQLVPENKALYSGKWESSLSGKSFPVFNPATGERLRSVPACSKEECEVCINTTSVSQKEWASKSPDERSSIIRKWADTIRENVDSLTALITAENGKSSSDARTEVLSGILALEWYAEEARRVFGRYVPSLRSHSKKQLIIHQPVGVVGVITPWNFPLSMITRKAGAALASGCSVIVKPSEDTPLWLHWFTKVGMMLYAKAANHGKRVLLEMGGNAPFIVFDSANLEKAITGTLGCKFRCSGQTCVSANRIFVHESIYDKFVTKLSEAVSRLHMGDGANSNVNLGPVINMKALNKIEDLVRSAIEMVPKLCRFRSEESVIELANETSYGLAGYIYTEDMGQAWRMAEKLQVGMVGLNTGFVSTVELPFGGVKNSGIGREGGPNALHEFMDIKTITWDVSEN
ncbi:unnamed protein product [Heterobilharzia americana]|nr:unnamed protein product [Heterobilharzia americana]